MQNTENFDLKIYEGEDLFNPLVVENANAQAIDNQMKKNENHTVGDATELVSGTVHVITRLTPDTPMLRFTATSRFKSGDTFTVDGVQVSALTVSGETLPDGAYIIGSEVLAYLKGTLLTFFTSQGTLATAQNALKLGGNTPNYYATSTAVQQAQDTATAAGNLANAVNSNLSNIDNILTTKAGFIGYASNTSLEGAINKFINSMESYVPYLIHGEQISGLPLTSSPNDACIEIIILNKSTNSYRIIIYDNKSTDIYTISRIDGEWKLWSKLNN